jgi:hypothetical protein
MAARRNPSDTILYNNRPGSITHAAGLFAGFAVAFGTGLWHHPPSSKIMGAGQAPFFMFRASISPQGLVPRSF